MKEETIYKVLDKELHLKEEAFKYEESLKNNLYLRARNLYLFWMKMLGYPGEHTAICLVNHFTGDNKFTFGQYKGSSIGSIILIDKQYIRWCLNNIKSFKLNKEEQALFDASTGCNIGGSSTEFGSGGTCETFYHDGDMYNSDLINLEKDWIK